MCATGILRLPLGLLFVAFTSAANASPPTICTPLLHSNIGCDFYAVTLPSTFLDQSNFYFGVDLLNSGTSGVNVSIAGGALVTPINFVVSAGASVLQQVPWVSAISTSTATSKIAGGAYHVTSTGPVSALQLNPTNYLSMGIYSYTSDGSLLIPVQSAGTAYRVVASPTWNAGGTQYPGDVAVVATATGTAVTIVASGTIEPGAGLNANGGSVVLDQGDVLLISSALDAPLGGYGSDLSGTLITSSAPVLVWAGHTGTYIPAGIGYADHLEEIQPPLSALGNDYYVVRPGNPSGSPTGAVHYVKLVGTVDATSVTTDPVIAGVPTVLQAGQAAVFEASVDFHLQSSQPVAVGLFMEGSQTNGFNGIGDPSQSLAIPTSQARRSLDFVTPAQLTPWFAQVVAPTGATVAIDASPVSGWSAIGSSGSSVALVPLSVANVVHHASGNRPFTLSVYSYPAYCSYWYPGSLGFGDIIFSDGFQ